MMLTIPGSCGHLCDGVTRRDFLRIGALGAAGLATPELLRGRALASASRPVGRAKSCILLFMGGGPPQMDTFDLKPDAPEEIRGELRPIPTTVTGLQISEQLPLLSRQMHRCAVIRTVSDEYAGGAHGQSVYLALTGHKNPRVNGDDIRPAFDDFPCMGAAVAHARGGEHALPQFVWLLDMHRRTFAGEGGGLLGQRFDPFRILEDPNRPAFRVNSIAPTREVPLDRLGGRRGLLDQTRRDAEAIGERTIMDGFQRRAFDMILSPQTQRAFDLAAEPVQVRDRYGRHKFGQGVLFSRRLVENGVPLVTVYWNGEEVPQGWDLHYRSYQSLKLLTPPLDLAFATLLDDLDARGLLDETLVVWMGEFGRNPRIEDMGGRSHWARCYSVVMAGAGIRPGVVHGRSDRHAAYPAEDPVTPQDVVATIYRCLGISTDTEIVDRLGRPMKLVQGTAIESVLAG